MVRTPRRRRAQHHVDSRDLALGLDEHPAAFDHAPGHVLGELVLGRDGIAEVGRAAGQDGRLAEGRVAAHELLHTRSTSMATSGHMRAQVPATVAAGVASVSAVEHGDEVALLVESFGQSDALLWTELYAEQAGFAALPVDRDTALQGIPPDGPIAASYCSLSRQRARRWPPSIYR